MHYVGDWIKANPVLFSVIVWPLLTGLVTAIFKPRTEAQYLAMNPRVAAFLKFVASIGWDVPKMLEGARQLVTGSTRNTGEPVITVTKEEP